MILSLLSSALFFSLTGSSSPVPQRPLAPMTAAFPPAASSSHSLIKKSQLVKPPSPLGLAFPSSDPRVAQLGAGWCRGPEIVWGEIEKEPGKFDWSNLDRSIAAEVKLGLEPIPVLVPRSSWGASAVPEGWNNPISGLMAVTPPADPAAWGRFVSAVIERYDGDGDHDAPIPGVSIRFYQYTPDILDTWSARVEDYIEFMRTTATAGIAARKDVSFVLGSIRDQDLDLLRLAEKGTDEIRIGGIRFDRDQLEKTAPARERADRLGKLLLDGKEFYSVVDVHHFESGSAIADRLFFLDSWLRGKGLKRKVLWSLYNAAPAGAANSSKIAGAMVQMALGSLYGGARRFAWPADARQMPDNETMRAYALIDSKGETTAAGLAFQDLAERLKDIQGISRWNVAGAPVPVTAYQLDTPQKRTAVVWAESAITVSFPATRSEVEVHSPGEAIRRIAAKDGWADLELGPAPLLVEGIGEPKPEN